MESEENSDQAENNCDWCGRSCGGEKYCCNKCKHEHAKAERTLSSWTKSALGRTINVLRGIGMICLGILLYFVMALVNVGLNFWLMSVNEPYAWMIYNIETCIRHIPGVSNSVSATTAGMFRFMPIGTMLFPMNPVVYIVPLLLVCLLSTAVSLWFGRYAFDANCFVLLLGVGGLVLLSVALRPKE